jgi:hypothetical protein
MKSPTEPLLGIITPVTAWGFVKMFGALIEKARMNKRYCKAAGYEVDPGDYENKDDVLEYRPAPVDPADTPTFTRIFQEFEGMTWRNALNAEYRLQTEFEGENWSKWIAWWARRWMADPEETTKDLYLGSRWIHLPRIWKMVAEEPELYLVVRILAPGIEELFEHEVMQNI